MDKRLQDLSGDALSKLVQLRAHLKGVSLKWTGDGIKDIDQLCLDYFYRRALNECLWNGLKQLMEMPETKTLPEPVYAQILSIVLRAQANFELKRAEAQSKEAKPQTTPGAPA